MNLRDETRRERVGASIQETKQFVLMPYTPRRKITPLTEEEKRVDYINNENARKAIQNLRRAKGALKIVVNAVARGEFPGSKEG